MFSEPDGGCGFATALAFLQYLYCSARGADSCGECPSCNRISKLIHPDVHFIFPTTAPRTSLSLIQEFRALVQQNPHFRPSEARRSRLATQGTEADSRIVPWLLMRYAVAQFLALPEATSSASAPSPCITQSLPWCQSYP